MSTPPAAPFSLGQNVTDGLAAGGRVYSVISAVIGIIVMIILVAFGISKLRDPRTATATATIVSFSDCLPVLGSNPGQTQYSCSVQVSFPVSDQPSLLYYTKKPLTVTLPTSPKIGDTVSLRYNPLDPSDATQEGSPRVLGTMLIGGGLAIGALTVGLAVLTFKSKGFAEFEGTAGLIRMV